MLRLLPKRTAPIRIQPLPGQVSHSVLAHPALVGQQHSPGVRDLEASLRSASSSHHADPLSPLHTLVFLHFRV